jgi:hypothetical protein
VIDLLNTKIASEKANAALAYVYFDYKNQPNQRIENIIASILKQILCQLDDLPDELETIYNTCILRHTSPDSALLTQCLIRNSKRFSSVFVVLDALDECDEKQLQKIIQLIKTLQEEKISVFLTMRPHLECVRSKLYVDPVVLPIAADEQDIQNFLQIELAKRDMAGSLRTKIKDRLTDTAQGM